LQLGSDCSLRAVSYPLAVILKLRLSYLGFAVRVHLAVRVTTHTRQLGRMRLGWVRLG